MKSPENSLVWKFSSVTHRFNCWPELLKFKRKWYSTELSELSELCLIPTALEDTHQPMCHI